MVEILKRDTRLLARGQADSGLFLPSWPLMLIVWWNRIPSAGAAACMARRGRGVADISDQAAQPHHLVLPELVSRDLRSFLLQGNGERFCPWRAASISTSSSPISINAFGASSPASGWRGFKPPPSPNFCSGFTRFLCRRCCWWRFFFGSENAIRGVPILCFFNRSGLSGFLPGIRAAGPRADRVSYLKTLNSLPLHGLVALPGDAIDAGQVGIGGVRRLSQRAYGTHHPGVVVKPEAFQAVGSALILPTLRASFLLQFIFDTTIRSTCSRGPSWRSC